MHRNAIRFYLLDAAAFLVEGHVTNELVSCANFTALINKEDFVPRRVTSVRSGFQNVLADVMSAFCHFALNVKTPSTHRRQSWKTLCWHGEAISLFRPATVATATQHK
jgi:hypothetical protein